MLALFLLCTGHEHHWENNFLRRIFINSTKFSSFQAAHLQTLLLESLAHSAVTHCSHHPDSPWEGNRKRALRAMSLLFLLDVTYLCTGTDIACCFLSFSSSVLSCSLYLQWLTDSYSTDKNSCWFPFLQMGRLRQRGLQGASRERREVASNTRD